MSEFPDVMEIKRYSVYVRADMLEPLPEDIVSLFKTTVAFDGKDVYSSLGGENTGVGPCKVFDEEQVHRPRHTMNLWNSVRRSGDKGDMAPLVISGRRYLTCRFWFYKAYNDQVMKPGH